MTTYNSTSYAAATIERPTFVCPKWCEVSQEAHLADLPDWEGFAYHRSEVIEVGGGIRVNLTATTTVGGFPDQSDRLATVNLLGLESYDALPVEVAAKLGAAILRLSDEAERG